MSHEQLILKATHHIDDLDDDLDDDLPYTSYDPEDKEPEDGYPSHDHEDFLPAEHSEKVKKPKLGPTEALVDIANGNAGTVAAGIYLREYKNLTTEVADSLIDAGYAGVVSWRLKQFKGLTGEVASRLIDSGKGHAVSLFPDRFEGLDHDATILRLIADKRAEIERDGMPDDKRRYMKITKHLHKFTLKPETLEELERQGFTGAVASYKSGRKHYSPKPSVEQSDENNPPAGPRRSITRSPYSPVRLDRTLGDDWERQRIIYDRSLGRISINEAKRRLKDTK